MKKFILTIAIALTAMAAAPAAERLESDYMGRGVVAYFNHRGAARGYTVGNLYSGMSHFDQYGRYIGFSIRRGNFAYIYNAYGWLLGRTRIR